MAVAFDKALRAQTSASWETQKARKVVAERTDSLWVVTSYFNPASYQRRLANFRAFRRNLSAPLLVVELVRPGRYELSDDDGDIVVRLEGEDCIWRKERLLNLAIARLPSRVKHAAWMDCDLIFDDPDWPTKAEARLAERGGLLQLFARSVHLPSSLDADRVTLDECRAAEPIVTGVAIARAIEAADFDANEAKLVWARKAVGAPDYYPTVDKHNCYGMAWAVRRGAIARRALRSQRHRRRRFDPDLRRNVAARRLLEPAREHGAAPARHLAMGRDRESRRRVRRPRRAGRRRLPSVARRFRPSELYRGRHEALVKHGFDPGRDIELTANGTWRWTNPEGPLAADVAAYFFARREDGEARAGRAARRGTSGWRRTIAGSR